jgi:hypothetical protein
MRSVFLRMVNSSLYEREEDDNVAARQNGGRVKGEYGPRRKTRWPHFRSHLTDGAKNFKNWLGAEQPSLNPVFSPVGLGWLFFGSQGADHPGNGSTVATVGAQMAFYRVGGR